MSSWCSSGWLQADEWQWDSSETGSVRGCQVHKVVQDNAASTDQMETVARCPILRSPKPVKPLEAWITRKSLTLEPVHSRISIIQQSFMNHEQQLLVAYPIYHSICLSVGLSVWTEQNRTFLFAWVKQNRQAARKALRLNNAGCLKSNIDQQSIESKYTRTKNIRNRKKEKKQGRVDAQIHRHKLRLSVQWMNCGKTADWIWMPFEWGQPKDGCIRWRSTNPKGKGRVGSFDVGLLVRDLPLRRRQRNVFGSCEKIW